MKLHNKTNSKNRISPAPTTASPNTTCHKKYLVGSQRAGQFQNVPHGIEKQFQNRVSISLSFTANGS